MSYRFSSSCVSSPVETDAASVMEDELEKRAELCGDCGLAALCDALVTAPLSET